MSYDKALVLSKQKAVIKSITDLLSVLSEIEVGDAGGNSGEIVLDDGSVMTLSLAADERHNSLPVERISVTNARLNLDIAVSRTKQGVLNKDDDRVIVKLAKPSSENEAKVIRLVKKRI
jgi:hypothetical protein